MSLQIVLCSTQVCLNLDIHAYKHICTHLPSTLEKEEMRPGLYSDLKFQNNQPITDVLLNCWEQ